MSLVDNEIRNRNLAIILSDAVQTFLRERGGVPAPVVEDYARRTEAEFDKLSDKELQRHADAIREYYDLPIQ